MRLVLEKSKYYRVKSGQTGREIEETLAIPANFCFEGAILPVCDCAVYIVGPFETYKSIAEKCGKEEEQIKNLNGNRLLYPSCGIFIPM